MFSIELSFLPVFYRLAAAVFVAALPTAALAQDFHFYPDDASYDTAVPTLEQVVGHRNGERITSHAEMERYLGVLAESSSRVELVRYGSTWEGRSLYYLVISSPENLARREEIQTGVRSLADPRELGSSDADRLIEDLPAVVWLSHSVHGNEISSTDAALLTAYHLAAANDELASDILERVLVIIDPLQNPDGRDRFVHSFRQTRSRWPDSNVDAAELNEPWPGGRTNHYLFDLNRDWFAQTQVESRAKVAAYLEWLPQVFADLHEMGSNGTYYFPPQAAPRNPNQQISIMDRIEVIGRNNARWFDRMGFDYFNRDVYDSFYPGYGASWPMYHGALGMTFEQASVRGLVRERSDDTTFHYRDSVRHHFIASLGTLEASAENRTDFLRHFYDFHRDAIREGESDGIREILIEASGDANRAARLVGLLMSQGIEVERAAEPFTNGTAKGYRGEDLSEHLMFAGTYRVSLAQPRKHLVKTLLAPEVPMERSFLAEQLRRYARRERDQIYDITGWSLPLLFGVDAAVTSKLSTAPFLPLDAPPAQRGRGDLAPGSPPRVAYLIPWGTHSAMLALARLQREGFRVHSAGRALSIGGRDFNAGTLLIKVHENAVSPGSQNSGAVRSPEELHGRMLELETELGVDVFVADSSWVTSGINFGNNQVRYLPRPRIGMVWDSPTSPYSAGPARYLLERKFEYPVTVVRAQDLRRADLSRFNVLILPSSFGGYGGVLGDAGARKIREWTEAGGTLVALGGAIGWLTSEAVAMLETEVLKKTNVTEGASETEGEVSEEGESDLSALERAFLLPAEENLAPVPGAILRVELDLEHWLTFGYVKAVDVLSTSGSFYRPLTLDRGRNVGVFAAEKDVLVSGFVWQEEKKLLAGTPYLMHARQGRGEVVAFVEDPTFRGYLDGLNLLLFNALFLGPGY